MDKKRKMPFFRRRKIYKSYKDFLKERLRVYKECAEKDPIKYRYWPPFYDLIAPIIKNELKFLTAAGGAKKNDNNAGNDTYKRKNTKTQAIKRTLRADNKR